MNASRVLTFKRFVFLIFSVASFADVFALSNSSPSCFALLCFASPGGRYVVRNGYSGQKFYTEVGIQMYNLLFTTLPVLFLGCFDRDVTLEDTERFPGLYVLGINDVFFNPKVGGHPEGINTEPDVTEPNWTGSDLAWFDMNQTRTELNRFRTELRQAVLKRMDRTEPKYSDSERIDLNRTRINYFASLTSERMFSFAVKSTEG